MFKKSDLNSIFTDMKKREKLTDYSLINAVKDVGMSHLISEIEKNRYNKISICFVETEDKLIPIGTSKQGGNPDLPENIPYPICKAHSYINYLEENIFVSETAMQLIMQINLEEIKPMDRDNLLPAKGMLYFFWNGEYPEITGDYVYKVFYCDCDVSELKRKISPVPPYHFENKAFENIQSGKITFEECLYEYNIKNPDGWNFREEFSELDGLIEMENYHEAGQRILGVPWGVNVSQPDYGMINLLQFCINYGCLHDIYWYINLKDLKNLNFDNVTFQVDID